MKTQILLLMLVTLFFINLDSVSAQSCLSINLPKDNFFLGETFQAEISITNPLEDITIKSIEFFTGSRKALFPVRVVKVSNNLFYIYFTISQAREGDHVIKIRTFCEEGDIIIGAEESKDFKIEKERAGAGYRWLSQEVSSVWGNTEENALAILALRNFDSDLAEIGVGRLKTKRVNSECWPYPSCRVKETALSFVALQKSGDPASRIRNWLLDAQNSLSIGSWHLALSSVQNGTCELRINNQSETLVMENGRATKTLTFGDDEIYSVNVECNLTLTEAKITHTYLGKVVDFSLEEQAGIYRKDLSNEKCWGASYRSDCEFEATAFAYYALTEARISVKGLEWLEENRDDVITLHQVFLNLLKEEDYFTEWLINNQAVEGYWKNTSLAVEGKIDPFLTAIAILSLSDKEDNEIISAISRGKEWLLDRILTLNRKDLAGALYFALPPGEIKDIISVSPGAVKVRFNESFELLVENKGVRDVNLTLSYLDSIEEVQIVSGSFKRISFEATSEENNLLTISYSGLYNIPIFVTRFIQGEEVVEDVTITLPQIKFSGEAKEAILDNEAKTLKVKLINSNPQPLENVFLTLTSELYRIVRVEPARLNLPANSETEILLIINDDKEAAVGVYEGEIRARNSVTASLPVRIEILASGEVRIKETCSDFDFQCCEEVAEDASTKSELDDTCPLELKCADECKEIEIEEEEKGRISPIAWIVLVVIVGSIILVIILRAKAKVKRKKGLQDVVGGIEDKWKARFTVKK